jgi:hypothetical protein
MTLAAGRRQRLALLPWLLLLAGASGFVAAIPAHETVDYSQDAGPAIAALTDLDFSGFFSDEPQMGLLSILLRWPFAALAKLWGGDQLDEYRLGVFACLFAAGLIGLVLAREMIRRGRGPAAIGLVLGLWFFNPASLQAINIGHPEEILGGALAVLAVLTAARSPNAGGVVLGLALATKQWALVVVPATLFVSRKPLKTAAIALAVWVPLELALVLGNFAAYRRLGDYGVIVGVPSGLWWLPSEILPASLIVSIARPLVLVAALAVAVAAWTRRVPRTVDAQLALLALTLLLRGLLDPTGNLYFMVPFLMAVLAYEGLARRGLPIVSIASIALLALTFHAVSLLSRNPTTNNLFYTAWALPLLAHLWLASTRHPQCTATTTSHAT